MLKQSKIVTRVIIGFILILAAAILLGALAANSIRTLSRLAEDIFQHPYTVSRSVLEVRADVLEEQKIMAALVQAANSAESEVLQQQLLDRTARIEANMSLVRQRFLGQKAEVADIDAALERWRAARNRTLALAGSGRRAEAIAATAGHDAALVDQLLVEIAHVSEFASKRATVFRDEAAAQGNAALIQILGALLLIAVAGLIVALVITRSIRQSLRQAVRVVQKLIRGSDEKLHVAEAISAGDLSYEVVVADALEIDRDSLPKDEMGVLIRTAVQLSEVQAALDTALARMTRALREERDVARGRDWLKSCRNDLNALLREEQASTAMATKALAYVVESLCRGVGAVYLFDEHTVKLKLAGSYGLSASDSARPGDLFGLGEGLIGQCAREQKVLSVGDVPAGHLSVATALGTSPPKLLLAIPLLRGNRLIGVMEVGVMHALSELEMRFVQAARENIANGIDANAAHERMADLLEETQSQAEELRVQQEELQQSNEELEERAQILEQQREKIRIKSQQAEAASEELRHTVEELQRTSTYKSEFLANMSHELRTPLNSLMILSSLLVQNKDGNLSAKQVDFAATIHSAGKDLLDLINDILDLAKVEAGHLQLNYADVLLADLADALQSLFRPMAEKSEVGFRVVIDADVPPLLRGDEQRVHQILKNLLANAFKFTTEGEVLLRVGAAGADNPLGRDALAFRVCDTGIGIPADKLDLIFQAFHQADGSISRKYGGTGLGLSISLELAHKMQGELIVTSEPGKGSVFSLYLPLQPTPEAAPLPSLAAASPAAAAQLAPAKAQAPVHAPAAAPKPPPTDAILPAPVADDREGLQRGDKAILIIEDDLKFAKILCAMVQERGFAALVAADGETGIALAERYLPSAVVLDVMLPHIDGWGVMRSLKDSAKTRHIPVHFITCLEDRQKALSMGAIGFLTKPASTEQLAGVFESIETSIAKSVKRLLIVEDNGAEAKSMVALLEERDVDIEVATSGAEALAALQRESFDCMVLDLGLADMSGFDLLERIQQMDDARRVPVIIHSGRELNHDDERKLRRFAESIIIKGAKSPERLLNEVTLFLHLVESNLHPNKQRMIRTALDKEAMLDGRKVLLVDDDMRNVFSLSSALAEKNMTVVEAENGKEALAQLQQHPDISLVLMDIMMPEMDGYAAMRAIRGEPRWARLPIIAMTAKALKGDHEKCMAAGASDYIAKPIDVDKLLSLIRVWVFQGVQ